MFELILSILSAIGVSGIIAAFFTYFWQKRKEIQIKENELKEKRYLCILLLMYAFVNPQEFASLKRHRPELQTKDDLRRELQLEWVNSWIYAGDDTIQSFKKFIENSNEDTFAQTILSMRHELWNKKSKLPLSTFSTKSFLEK
jgi:hypothetical protein